MATQQVILHKSELGDIQINASVFESIAMIVLDEFKDAFLERNGFHFNLDQEGITRLEVLIKVSYGQNAQRLAVRFQEKLHQVIFQMTDVAIDQININVTGFQFK